MVRTKSPETAPVVAEESPTTKAADAPAEGFALNGEAEKPAEPAREKKPRAKRMVVDNEIQLMNEFHNRISKLEPSAAARVVAWLVSRFAQPTTVAQ